MSRSDITLLIDLFSQPLGTPKPHDPPCPQDQVFPSLMVSAFACLLVFQPKFTKAADQDIFPGFQGPFDDF
jgi:hypothetical protein